MIRQATIEDSEAIAVVAVEAWKWAYSPFLPPEIMATRTDVAQRAARTRERWDHDAVRLVSLDEADQVVGFAFSHIPSDLDGYDSEIGALYVHPKAARSGVGGALIGRMVEEFIARGMHNMAIHTLEGNQIGRSFYEKVGGVLRATDEWNGRPAVWYVWDNLLG